MFAHGLVGCGSEMEEMSGAEKTRTEAGKCFVFSALLSRMNKFSCHEVNEI